MYTAFVLQNCILPARKSLRNYSGSRSFTQLQVNSVADANGGL